MANRSGEESHNKISGGYQYGPTLQGRDFSHITFVTHQTAAAPIALAQLPTLVAGFTGRKTELAQMAKLLNPTAGSEAVVVSAVAGLAGVGKTALAIHAGHAALAAGWFPGGALFINLHGYDETPVQVGQALDALLRALGVLEEHIPERAEERAGLYRSVLAQITDPVLIIADNASNEVQVRQLLPGPGPHRVIITSRHSLAGLGARLLDVTVLDQGAAVTLLDVVLRTARPGDKRIRSDGGAARRLAEICGGLPLALQITAALLATDPALTAGELADALADEVGRLKTLQYDDGGASGRSVAAAFELSYRQLDEDAKRLFRLLSADPGPDVSTAAAAALVGWIPNQVRTVIGRLIKAHLIEAGGSRSSRWRMHDLLRLYARQLSDNEADERDKAIGRVLAYYLDNARAADVCLEARRGTSSSAKFTDRVSALAWLDAERRNLIAAVTIAADTGRDEIAMDLPLHLGRYLSWRRQFEDSLTVQAIARDSARRQGHQEYEAEAVDRRGVALREMRRFEEAIDAHQGAAEIFRAIGSRHGEGTALNNLGVALRGMRRLGEAISAHQKAAVIFRKAGNRHGEGSALDYLGVALRNMGRLAEAISAHQMAAEIFRETGDRDDEGMALDHLGVALRGMRRLGEAISAHQKAAEIFQETGRRHDEGSALDYLGIALREIGRLGEAISAHQDAAAAYRETGDRNAEGSALDNLGMTLRRAGRFEDAISAHQKGVAAYRETGHRSGEGVALDRLGQALGETGRLGEAISAHRKAVEIFRETGDRDDEGIALDFLGIALRRAGQSEQAISAHQEAAAVFREIGDRHGEAFALDYLGLALREVGRLGEAVDVHQKAVEMLREAGDPRGLDIALRNLELVRKPGIATVDDIQA